MNLREYIEDRGITVREFSRRTNVNVCTIHRILKGYINITLDTAYKIVKFTEGKVSYEALMENTNTKKESKKKPVRRQKKPPVKNKEAQGTP